MILTVEQAARLLQFEPATIRRLAARGEIPARKVAGVWRFHQEQLEAFIREGQPLRPAKPEVYWHAKRPIAGAAIDPNTASAIAKFANRPAQPSGPKSAAKPQNDCAVNTGDQSN